MAVAKPKKKVVQKPKVKIVKTRRRAMGARINFSEEDKARFALLVNYHRTLNPDASQKAAIHYAREKFPPEQRCDVNISSFKQISWLPSYLEAAQKKAAQMKKGDGRVSMDHRVTVATPEDEQPEQKKNGRSRATKTFLTAEQKKQYAEACYYINLASPGRLWEQVMAEANEVLPPHQKLVPKPRPSGYPWLPGVLRQVHEDKLRADRNPPAPSPEVVETPHPVGEDSFMMELAKALAPIVRPMLQSPKFQGMLGQQLVGETSSSAPKPTPQRKKILIVGLLGAQGQEVQREWSRHFDLRIYDNTVTSDKIKSLLPNVDAAILMTKFVSHPTQNAMRGHPKFRFCNGTIVAVKDILADMMQKS